MPSSLLDEPLSYIFADHFRQRKICSALRRFALTGRVDHREAEAVATFLKHDVVLNQVIVEFGTLAEVVRGD